MINDTYIQAPELCTLQFREPREHLLYPEQVNEYCPKIWNQELRIQVLGDAGFYSTPPIIVIYDDKGYYKQPLLRGFTVSLLPNGSAVLNVVFTKAEIAAMPENDVICFSIENNTRTVIYAQSLWYKVNPSFTKDLKQITYSHGSSDWNVQFNSNEFTLTLEAGFTPQDSRDEQEVDDFMQQNMVNETVYGDSYEVIGLTYGNKTGIPNWLRRKLDMASLCDTFKVNDESITRIQGAKIERIAEGYHGLGIYKLDVQTLKNYLQ